MGDLRVSGSCDEVGGRALVHIVFEHNNNKSHGISR